MKSAFFDGEGKRPLHINPAEVKAEQELSESSCLLVFGLNHCITLQLSAKEVVATLEKAVVVRPNEFT